MARVRLGIYLEQNGPKLGAGKMGLLRAIQSEGSISAAARSLDMGYRHAWVLVNELNECFAEPVVRASAGGSAGGGAELTPWGEELVERFEKMERAALGAIRGQLGALERRLASAKRRPGC